MKKGLKKGRAEGEKIGIEKGEKIGIEKGRAEGEKQKAIDIAKRLKSINLPIEKIEEATGLSQNEIDNL